LISAEALGRISANLTEGVDVAANVPPENAPMPENDSTVPPPHGGHGETPPNSPPRTYGVVVVVVGLGVVAFCFAVALYVYRNVASATDSATAVATVLAPVTGVIGAVVGAYFGFQAGSAGTAMAQAAATEAQAMATEALTNLAAVTAVTPASAADQIHEILGVSPSPPRASRTAF